MYIFIVFVATKFIVIFVHKKLLLKMSPKGSKLLFPLLYILTSLIHKIYNKGMRKRTKEQ